MINLSFSLKDLYKVAILEGEGLGTAYEYFVKQRILNNFALEKYGSPSSILIYGLPEKYGTSMDFVLFSHVHNCSISLCEDRPLALKKFKDSLKKLMNLYSIKENFVKIFLVKSLAKCEKDDLRHPAGYDLVVNSDVLQRFSLQGQLSIVECIMRLGKRALLFIPNGENINHQKLPDWKGVFPNELIRNIKYNFKFRFIDMPPFPSGYKLEGQKKDLLSKKFILFFSSKILELWSTAEGILPDSFRRKFSHAFYLNLF